MYNLSNYPNAANSPMILENKEFDINEVVKISSYISNVGTNSGVLLTDGTMISLKMRLPELLTHFDDDFFTHIEGKYINFKTMTSCEELKSGGSKARFGTRVFEFKLPPSGIESHRLMEGVEIESEDTCLSL